MIEDTLSAILRNVRLRGSIYFSSRFCSPWGLDIEQGERASFHIVVRGQCWLQLNGESRKLQGGDIVILPRGAKHQIYDHPDSGCLPGSETIQAIQVGNNPFSSDEEDFDIVCGYFEFDHATDCQILKALPELLHFTQDQRIHFAFLDTALQLVVAEARMREPGRAILLDRVTELLFIQVIRVFIQLNQGSTNIFAALKDRALALALNLMHTTPQAPWTLESLAREAGMSRSRFANHFHKMLGETPMRYLLQCRMQLARQRLEETRSPLNVIAEEVGYTSDSAFKRAFKRFYGTPPSEFRRTAR